MDILDDHTLNELALDWYCLNEQARNQKVMPPDDLFNDLVEAGFLLKVLLKQSEFTKLQPMNAVVRGNIYFDIWLDDDDQIQSSDLYSNKD